MFVRGIKHQGKTSITGDPALEQEWVDLIPLVFEEANCMFQLNNWANKVGKEQTRVVIQDCLDELLLAAK